MIFAGYQAKRVPGRGIQRYGPRFGQGKAPGFIRWAGIARMRARRNWWGS